MSNLGSPPPPKLSPSAERMIRKVESRQASALRARSQKDDISGSLSILGLVGWSVSVPTLVGAAVGAWVDHRCPSRFSWTLMLLVSGLVLGCANAWVRIRRDQP
jgi:ATP synthase protein I